MSIWSIVNALWFIQEKQPANGFKWNLSRSPLQQKCLRRSRWAKCGQWGNICSSFLHRLTQWLSIANLLTESLSTCFHCVLVRQCRSSETRCAPLKPEPLRQSPLIPRRREKRRPSQRKTMPIVPWQCSRSMSFLPIIHPILPISLNIFTVLVRIAWIKYFNTFKNSLLVSGEQYKLTQQLQVHGLQYLGFQLLWLDSKGLWSFRRGRWFRRPFGMVLSSWTTWASATWIWRRFFFSWVKSYWQVPCENILLPRPWSAFDAKKPAVQMKVGQSVKMGSSKKLA